MVRNVCLIVFTVAWVGYVGWMITNDVQQRRELADFQERLTARLATMQWREYQVAPEVEG